MRLIDQLERDGGILFRWRSLLPLVFLPAWLVAIADGAVWQESLGEGISDLWTAVTLVVSLAGLALRCATIGCVPAGSSGRNTRRQHAEVLNTTGMYSVVRHPLYLGNGLMILGVALATKTLWFPVVAGLGFWLYIERVIIAEEAFLAERFGQRFLRWAANTPAFLPRLRGWRPSALSFSLRTVLQREHHGFLGVSAAFTAFEAFVDLFVEGDALDAWLDKDWPWPVLLAAATVLYLTVQALRKRTHLLQVPGR